MSDPWQAAERRVLELLADRATFGLTRNEEKELGQLLESMPGFDAQCMDRAAATVQLALASAEPMPDNVVTRIRESGIRYVSSPPRE